MPLLVASLNIGAAAIAADITAISLHTADPGATGTSEVTGGSPAYARKVPTWSAPSAGACALSSPLTFDVPASTVTHVGYWSGSTYRGGDPLPVAKTNATQGTVVIDQLTVPSLKVLT